MKYSIQNSFGDLSFDCTGARLRSSCASVDCICTDCLELFAKFTVANPCRTFYYFDVTSRQESKMKSSRSP